MVTSELISAVRSLLDESNTAGLDDTTDIIASLNRAQDVAANILSRHYESPLLTYTVQAVSTQEFDLPEAAFEERLERIEVKYQNLYYPVKRISYRDVSLYESPYAVAVPEFYCVIGNQIRLLPAPAGSTNIRVWYLEDPLPLVLEQGRVNIVNTAGNYVYVDAAGSSLTTESDQLASFVNVIDGQSGKRKATLQIKTINGNKIEFRTSPTRSVVRNLTVDTSLGDISINPDDYICLVTGTCIPVLKKPFSNYIIQYAVAELRRKLGEPSDMEERIKQDLEKIVERSWVGREQTLRVKRMSNNWGTPIRRQFLFRDK